MCHVISRGDRREDIFLDDEELHDLLKPTEKIQQIVSRVHLGTSWNAKARLHVRLQPREGERWHREQQRGQKMNEDLSNNEQSEGLTLS